MIMLQRKLRCKFMGDKKYLPESITPGKWMPIIGFETRKRRKETRGIVVEVEDLYYLVVNDNWKVETIASFNCHTMIDNGSASKNG